MRRILCIGISFLTLCAAACSSYWDTAIKNTYAYLGRSIPIPAFHAAIPFDEIAFQMPDTERLTEEIARLKERVNSGEAAKGLQSELFWKSRYSGTRGYRNRRIRSDRPAGNVPFTQLFIRFLPFQDEIQKQLEV